MTEILMGYGEAIVIGEITRPIKDLIISSNKLGVLNNKTLVPELYKHLRFEEDAVYLKAFWAGDICTRGGWYKREFVNWQILAFELWELINQEGNIKILVRDVEFELNTDKPQKRDERNVIQMIKHYKKMNRTGRKGCKYFACDTLDLHSQLCCICGDKDIKLLRRKEDDKTE